MTARELQSAVKADLEELFQAVHYKVPPDLYGNYPEYQAAESAGDTTSETAPAATDTAEGAGMGKLSVFEQELPIREGRYEEPFPYILVRVESGGILSPVDPHKVELTLLVGIYEDSRDNQGHKTVLEIMERIQAHYEQNPTLSNGAFQFTDPFYWVLQDEPSFPYYYGACNVSFNCYADRMGVHDYT